MRFSRGFSSIYGEWETTAEAKSINRTFSESLRFPLVDKPVRLVDQEARRAQPVPRGVERALDPAGQVRRARRDGRRRRTADQASRERRSGEASWICSSWATATRRRSAASSSATPGAWSPCCSRRRRSRSGSATSTSGVCRRRRRSRASAGRRSSIFSRTPLGTTYDAFDSERYVLTFDNRAFRDLAANAPYDVVEILVNSATYGGGGIFGLYSTVAADSAWAPYIFVHEFGHHLAALADEYYTSDVAYLPAAGSRRAVGAERHGAARSGRVEMEGSGRAGTPLPTPWPKRSSSGTRSRFSSGGARSGRRTGRSPRWTRCSARSSRSRRHCSGAAPYAAKVGAFEGANYEARGFFRPQTDCVMFTRDLDEFCAVCRRAIARMLDLYSR